MLRVHPSELDRAVVRCFLQHLEVRVDSSELDIELWSGTANIPSVEVWHLLHWRECLSTHNMGTVIALNILFINAEGGRVASATSDHSFDFLMSESTFRPGRLSVVPRPAAEASADLLQRDPTYPILEANPSPAMFDDISTPTVGPRSLLRVSYTSTRRFHAFTICRS